MSVELLDLSHTIEPGMPRFPGFEPPVVRAVWTHAEAPARGYEGTTCEVTEVRFVTSLGTYLDAPYHFDPQGTDVGGLPLDQLVRPGLVVDLRERGRAGEALPLAGLEGLEAAAVQGRALLLCTGWSDYWGEERYLAGPFVGREMAARLRALGPALVGIDTLVLDSLQDPARPAHTTLLRAGVLIVENLTGLAALVGRAFTFVAAPAKVAGAAAFPVRAFAICNPAA